MLPCASIGACSRITSALIEALTLPVSRSSGDRPLGLLKTRPWRNYVIRIYYISTVRFQVRAHNAVVLVFLVILLVNGGQSAHHCNPPAVLRSDWGTYRPLPLGMRGCSEKLEFYSTDCR